MGRVTDLLAVDNRTAATPSPQLWVRVAVSSASEMKLTTLFM